MNKNDIIPQWDLSDLYKDKNSKELKDDLAIVTDRVKRFNKLFINKINSIDVSLLASAIKEYEQIGEIIGKISSYAFLLYAQNIEDQENVKFYQNISETLNNISLNLLFFDLEINKMEEEDFTKKINHEYLKHYAPWLRDIRIMRPHQLSNEMEELLHEKDIVSKQSWVRLFDETLASLRFKFKEEILSCSEIFNKLSSHDGEERKIAALSIGEVLKDNIRIFSHITNILAKDKSIDDNKRNFLRPISARNLSNLVEDEITDALIETVRNNYPKVSHRYYALKAKIFGKEQLNYWDRNAPYPNIKEEKITWQDASKIVLNAYREFSPFMADIGEKFFHNNWIDAMPTKGKDSGAFSHSTVPSVHPYILMNFHGKIRDVMTLAHELGHGVHQYLSRKNGYLMADTPLTLAETASVFGEQLTFRSLLKSEKDQKQRQLLLASKIEDMLNTAVRQIAFCLFEIELHDKRKKSELSAEEICQIWLKVQKESLGNAIKLDEEYKYYWSYIPHFIHSPFYVYAYAFGDCLVNSLYDSYMKKPEGFVQKYITMLESGGTLRHKELLAPFGLDASNPEFWQGGLNVISSLINEFEQGIDS